ncbi:MAG: HIT family protein [Anaerolineae bacterium]|nr:HIT family protein [Anaerolineae bacterium]
MERNCIFCAIARGQAPAEVVYEDAETMAFLDINPAAPGHTLVIPRRHYRNLFDLDPEAGAAVMRTAVRVARALREALRPDGMNMVQANERAGFQSVFHFHVHLVPRWLGDGIAPPWRQRPADAATLREVGAKIRRALAPTHETEEQDG